MKILQVILGMKKAAGTSVFCAEVCNALVAAGHEVTLAYLCFVPERDYPVDKRVREWLIKDLDISPRQYDIAHVHGLWSPELHQAIRKIRAAGVPYVLSPHGMSAPWSFRHKWWKKWPAWFLYQRDDMKAAAAIHCTTELEAKWNGKFNACFVVPIGTFMPPEIESLDKGGVLRVLFVGRIYPVKGLVNLVRAAEILKLAGVSAVRFRIVGPNQAGHQEELLSLATSLGVADLFDWAGPKFGDELAVEYDACDMLILPSFTENFGAVVVDALAHGKPVLASRYTPWETLVAHKCGWWVDNAPGSLAETFKNILSLSREQMRQMGVRGRALAKTEYEWTAIAEKLVCMYTRYVK